MPDLITDEIVLRVSYLKQVGDLQSICLMILSFKNKVTGCGKSLLTKIKSNLTEKRWCLNSNVTEKRLCLNSNVTEKRLCLNSNVTEKPWCLNSNVTIKRLCLNSNVTEKRLCLNSIM